MKKGDKVTITDGSYTKSVVGGKLVHEFFAYDDEQYEQYKQYVIIETNCKFPADNDQARSVLGVSGTFNNTVIQAVNSGKVVFIEERFLELVPPTHKVVVDIILHPGYGVGGKVIEISDKLYKEIKRELQAKQTHTWKEK